MLLHDALHSGQPDAGAFKLILAVQPLKHAEEFVREARVKARAVIADEKNRLALFLAAADFNHRFGLILAEFDRVREQVDPNLAE